MLLPCIARKRQRSLLIRRQASACCRISLAILQSETAWSTEERTLWLTLSDCWLTWIALTLVVIIVSTGPPPPLLFCWKVWGAKPSRFLHFDTSNIVMTVLYCGPGCCSAAGFGRSIVGQTEFLVVSKSVFSRSSPNNSVVQGTCSAHHWWYCSFHPLLKQKMQMLKIELKVENARIENKKNLKFKSWLCRS